MCRLRPDADTFDTDEHCFHDHEKEVVR